MFVRLFVRCYTPGIYAEGYIVFYTPGIYAEGYIVFALMFVRSFVTFRHVRRICSKFLVKVSLSEYISITTHQKAFIFEPWVPERVSFYAMSFGPRFMPQGGAKGQNLGHC